MKDDDIPVLDDLIEKGIEITLSDLGLDDEPSLRVEDVRAEELEIDIDDAAPLATDSLAGHPGLEREVRRILDEHMELAWQEIRLAIQKHLDRS